MKNFFQKRFYVEKSKPTSTSLSLSLSLSYTDMHLRPSELLDKTTTSLSLSLIYRHARTDDREINTDAHTDIRRK